MVVGTGQVSDKVHSNVRPDHTGLDKVCDVGHQCGKCQKCKCTRITVLETPGCLEPCKGIHPLNGLLAKAGGQILFSWVPLGRWRYCLLGLLDFLHNVPLNRGDYYCGWKNRVCHQRPLYGVMVATKVISLTILGTGSVSDCEAELHEEKFGLFDILQISIPHQTDISISKKSSCLRPCLQSQIQIQTQKVGPKYVEFFFSYIKT